MKAKLVSPISSPPEWEIELDQFPVVIGRSPDAEIQPGDPSVSEQHCEIEELDGKLMVHDLGSECGTFVNGVQVDMAPLLPGDKLTVGKSSFIASYDPRQRETSLDLAIREDGDLPSVDGDDDASVTFFGLVKLLDRQREIFREHYDREPWQAEPMFPDPPHPEHIEHLIAEEMKNAGVEPQFIYAFEKTGILVTEFNYDSIPVEQLAEWQAAIDEYEDCYGDWEEEQQYPVGAITLYGPDKSITTMIVAAVIGDEESEPIYRSWVGSMVKVDAKVQQQINEFFLSLGVRSVIYVRENVGCPHLEGIDYPDSEDCPFCPYWKGRQ